MEVVCGIRWPPGGTRCRRRCAIPSRSRFYGGILIVWDRLFGSYQEETHRPHYGLTKPVNTYNIWRLQTAEYAAIARDFRAARRWRDKLGYVFRPPGWAPADRRAEAALN